MKQWLKIILGVIGGIVLLFVIDLVCIFTINKPILAINDKNDSVNLIYKGLLYDTYICHNYDVPQIKIKGIKFSCEDLNMKSLYKVTEVENVSISISDVSMTGATIIIKDTNKEPYVYGEWYKIEKENNGKWYELKTIVDNYGFNEIGYVVDKNNEVKFVINWEWLYGKLSFGDYRILKQVNNRYIYIEFSITSTSNKKIEVIKPENYNSVKFNKYLEKENKTIYLAGNIEEVYYTNDNTKVLLKDYIMKTYQTMDDVIKKITNELKLVSILKDGGTKIYKLKEYDITVIKCNTIEGNNDIFIGDYLMKFDNDSMCK